MIVCGYLGVCRPWAQDLTVTEVRLFLRGEQWYRYVIQGPNDPWFPDNVPILFSGSAAVTCPTPCRVETSEKALGRVGAALGASGSPGGRAELLVLRKSLSPAGPPPDKPFSFAGF